jgi:tetratricopeptide (TPR) repeat protein
MRKCRAAAGILAFLAVIFLLSCTHTTRDKDVGNAEWKGQMHGMAQAFSELLPLLSSPSQFSAPQNRATLTRSVKTLASGAHKVTTASAEKSGDPSLAFVANKFSADMQEAVRQIDLENFRFARHLLQNTTNYCIACHTRTDEGRKNLNLSALQDVSHLRPLERAEYHIAMRDFDLALKDFDRILRTADAQIESPQAIEVAAEKALAVIVRVKRDPELARATVQQIADSQWAPIYLRLNAVAWKTAVDEWVKEGKSNKLEPKQLLTRAKALLAKGWKFSVTSPQNRAGLIYFLRASTLLHDLLSADNADNLRAEAFYNAGLAAESLRNINLWTMQEAYYESCIRKVPFSAQAKKCYLRLEALTMSTYADLDGVYVPAHVRDHLRELKAMVEKPNGQFLDWGYINE